jgi:hypothetical protein
MKQSRFVQEYIDKFFELVDQMNAYNRRVDPLFCTTKFIDGLRADIHMLLLYHKTSILHAIWHCCTRSMCLHRHLGFEDLKTILPDQMYRVQESQIRILIVGGGYSLANSFIIM